MLEERARRFFAGGPRGRAGETEVARQLDRFAAFLEAGEYTEAYHKLRAERKISDADKKAVIAALNDAFLFKRNLEWGNHGIRRTFRFWSNVQKEEYIRRANEIVDFIRVKISPNVTFGFGSVLGFVRDHDFIPHDDDMDLLVAFDPKDGDTFASVRAHLKDAFEAAGFTVRGEKNLSHITVVRGSYAGTDVFVGFFDPDGTVSWFPSRRGLLQTEDVFPTQAFTIFGVDCPIPRRPEAYLAATYGHDWREPIPNWNHPWDRTQYAEFL